MKIYQRTHIDESLFSLITCPVLWEKLTNRSRLHCLGILLAAIVIVSLSVIFLFQNSSSKTVFEVMPIAMPQWATDLDKPASYINLSVKNTGSVNQTSVVVKLSGGFANSSNEVPEQLSWIVKRRIDAIHPGEARTKIKSMSPFLSILVRT